MVSLYYYNGVIMSSVIFLYIFKFYVNEYFNNRVNDCVNSYDKYMYMLFIWLKLA